MRRAGGPEVFARLMRRLRLRCRRPPSLAGVSVVLGLLVYLLPLYGASPRPAPGGAIDRALGIVFARHRQADVDGAADERPVARPFAPAVVPACLLALTVPGPVGCLMAGRIRSERVWHGPFPGRPRSPPIL
jgi:hypothetical protein